MKKNIRLADIAKRAGISPAAAGVVLTGAGKGKIRISPQKAALVRAVAKELNYHPNQLARNLAMRNNRTIGVLIDPRAAELTTQRLMMLDRETRKRNYRIMIGYEALDREVINQYLNDFTGWGANGVLCVHHHYPGDHSLIPRLVSERFNQAVFIDEPAQPGLWSVGVDYAGAIHLLVEHLLKRGRRRIGLILNDMSWYSEIQYRQGYIFALENAGIAFDSRLLWTGTEHGCSSETPLLHKKGTNQLFHDVITDAGADALITADTLWVLEILNMLREKGIQVPKDISLATCGNSPVLAVVSPNITGMDMRVGAVAERAAELLLNIIEDKEAESPRAEILSPIIEIGQSS